MKDSPIQSTHSNFCANPAVENTKFSLLFQLEQRKVVKLERENRALLERVNNLLSQDDEARIELLVADKTRRKLVQLRAITERTMKSLESGLNEFQTFVDDIDETMNEEERRGALRPLKIDTTDDKNERILNNFSPKLKRIPESPMVSSSTATSKLGSILESIHKGMEEEEKEKEDDERVEETVDETLLLDSVGAEQKDEEQQSEKGKQPKNEPGSSVTLRQRPSAIKLVLKTKKQTDVATYNSGDRTPVPVPVDDSRSFFAASFDPSTSLSDSTSASARPKRAAATKIGSYQLPSLSKKMRRDNN
uniref:Shugoshin C-terminal domain-containing protein n=1 Tax=Globodera rostochiensis TaxID=31243 RepID=A0A914HHN4_GLORO